MQEQIEAVQRMQEYIETNLSDCITLEKLSKVSWFSPWYSHRLFVSLIGMTPAEYVRKLRLSKSALKLRDNNCKITDVAYEIGFESVNGYQRAFRREFGCSPHEYACNPVPIWLFIPYEIKLRYSERKTSMENVKNVFIQVIEKPNRKAIIRRGVKATEYMSYCEEVGSGVWGLLKSIKSISGEPVCLWLPDSYRKSGTSGYVLGVEVAVDYDGVIPEGFNLIELPAAKYLMFQGEPFIDEDYYMAIEEVKTAIHKYDPTIIGYQWDKENPRIQFEPIRTRGYIELMPIKMA